MLSKQKHIVEYLIKLVKFAHLIEKVLFLNLQIILRYISLMGFKNTDDSIIIFEKFCFNILIIMGLIIMFYKCLYCIKPY